MKLSTKNSSRLALPILMAVAATSTASPTVTVRVVPANYDPLTNPTPQVGPGAQTTVNVIVDITGLDPAIADSIILGNAGIHGFAGEILVTNASDPSITTGLTGIAPQANSQLQIGAVLTNPNAGGFIGLAGGRGTNDDPNRLLGPEANETTASVEIWNTHVEVGSSLSGSFNLEYRGAVVLVVGDELRKFTTGTGTHLISPDPSPISISIDCVSDLTTTNTNPGNPGYGVPDGRNDGADLTYFVERWLIPDNAVADFTTTNTNPGDPGYGVPDGTVDGNDLSFYVEVWLSGCGTVAAS